MELNAGELLCLFIILHDTILTYTFGTKGTTLYFIQMSVIYFFNTFFGVAPTNLD